MFESIFIHLPMYALSSSFFVAGCPTFTCKDGLTQKGYDISTSKEETEARCANRCRAHKGCIGYDYNSLLKDCWLSATPWFKVAPTGGLLNAPQPFMKSCQCATGTISSIYLP